MKHSYAILSLAVGSLIFAALAGCQAAGPASSSPTGAASGDDAAVPVRSASAAGAVPALAPPSTAEAGATVAQRSGSRVHVLLARRVDLPVEVNKRVSLGAGDELGEQMFERYASIVRAQQQPDERQLVGIEPVAPLRRALLPPAARPWVERVMMAATGAE